MFPVIGTVIIGIGVFSFIFFLLFHRRFAGRSIYKKDVNDAWVIAHIAAGVVFWLLIFLGVIRSNYGHLGRLVGGVYLLSGLLMNYLSSRIRKGKEKKGQ